MIKKKRVFSEKAIENISKAQLKRFKDKSNHPRWKGGKIVHHINDNKEDNRIENLMLFLNKSAHTRYHWEQNNKTFKSKLKGGQK
jgi:hypothetical protein